MKVEKLTTPNFDCAEDPLEPRIPTALQYKHFVNYLALDAIPGICYLRLVPQGLPSTADQLVTAQAGCRGLGFRMRAKG